MKNSKTVIAIDSMAMGKKLDMEDEEQSEMDSMKGMKIGDMAAKKLGMLKKMQDGMDKASVAMFKQFNRKELDAMEKAHEKMVATHRRIVSMIDSIEGEDDD